MEFPNLERPWSPDYGFEIENLGPGAVDGGCGRAIRVHSAIFCDSGDFSAIIKRPNRAVVPSKCR